MANNKFQRGDLVNFSSYKPPVANLSRVGIVVESKCITHAERGYNYEAVTVQFGDHRFDLPAVDFELIKRM